jgi:phosphoribosylglycinamide formyltransferase-1
VVNRFGYPDPTEKDQAMLEFLLEFEVVLVLLLGYLKKIGPKVLNAYRGRLLNIHPALLPTYGGPGMYGIHVHQAVLEAKEKETGVTVHHVDEIYDNGPILAQCRIDVLVSDTPESLADRVLHCEHAFLVETLRNLENGDLELS